MKKYTVFAILVFLCILTVSCSQSTDKSNSSPVKNTKQDNTVLPHNSSNQNENNAANSADKKTANETQKKTTDDTNATNHTATKGPSTNTPKDSKIGTVANEYDNIDTSKSPFTKGYHDYQGVIGNNLKIQMSIYPLEKNLIGSYFYESQRKELDLKGKAGANQIIFYEYDKTGKMTGIFTGTMKTVDKIEGTWISSDEQRSYPFTLTLNRSIYAEYGKRYHAVTDYKSDREVEDFASQIQQYVKNGNKEKLAEYIYYPIKVNHSRVEITIHDKKEFIQNFDQIFYPEYKKSILDAFPKYMFVNWQGIMFGTNLYNVWFEEGAFENGTSKFVITCINN